MRVIYLTDDILVEILLRLPVKSLLRFLCVCKKWCYLIETSYFIDRHLSLRRVGGDEHLIVKRMVKPPNSHHAAIYVLDFYGGFESLSVLTAPPDFEFGTHCHTSIFLVFAGYVNGIVCISDYGTVNLLNPALREYRTLPARPFGCPSGSYCRTEAIGFGYDDITNDYKVVKYIEYRSRTSSGQSHFEAEVYRLSTNSWKGLGNMPEYSIDSSYSPVFLNGCVHWLASSLDDIDNDIILGFNMSSELFQDMQLPDYLKDYESERLKGLFVMEKSTIALVAFADPFECNICGDLVNVWVMKEYGVRESWVKQYSITPLLKIEKPLSFWQKDKLVLVTIDGELVYYDLPTGELHLLCKYDPIEGEDSVATSLGMVLCTESLFPIRQVFE